MTTSAALVVRDLLASGARWRVDIPDSRIVYPPHAVTRSRSISGVAWRYCRACGGWRPATRALLTSSHGTD